MLITTDDGGDVDLSVKSFVHGSKRCAALPLR